MFFDTLNTGYTPRKHPGQSILLGVAGAMAFTGTSSIALSVAATLSSGFTIEGALQNLLYYWGQLVQQSFALPASIGVISGAIMARQLWKDEPRNEPFVSLDPADPKIFCDQNAEVVLNGRIETKAGSDKRNGVFIAPYIALSERLERRNILIAGRRDRASPILYARSPSRRLPEVILLFSVAPRAM